ncbi:D-glycero-beta-D-manno-heptose 1-phosphate adenylyltransferase [Olivibacter sp. XZL3]|uniref:D-glycero-beta-D-manno-heptose 1-phosphate adenylyltransferase n=1 Tax=Olivibacter sp. XZL3 TaxID=1735116 RepID=UPI0010652690|nr:D-glycero-beta-D-manno-heptose 1-phosphate adenylyltransferase [Olivibacter sp. XZL3]
MSQKLLELIHQFEDKKVLVVGDFILDVFVYGGTSRISPEAPVPVVDVQEKVERLGGAGNVAANLQSLGASVFLCSVVGEDLFESRVKPLLNEHKIQAQYLVHDDERLTEVKTRIVADQHTLLRFDEGDHCSLNESSESLLIDLLEEAYQGCDAVIIADYEKGVISERVIASLVQLQERFPKFVAIDSKRLSSFKALQPDLVKPNYKQAISLLGLSPGSDRIAQVTQASKRLLEETKAKCIALTLDADGAVWMEEAKKPLHFPIASVAQADVCGAGDTYLGAATLALISNAEQADAAQIAEIASRCVVEKSGTAVCTRVDLIDKIVNKTKVLDSEPLLACLIEQLKAKNKRIVFTNGCFDIMHCGHTHYLQQAKKLGDVLVVGVNSDESVGRFKGKGRPINVLADRMHVLAAFSSVDYIISFGNEEDGDNPANLIRALKPDVVVKGEDYKHKQLPELKAINEVGAELVLLPFTHGKSTTNIIRRIQGNSAPNQLTKLKA